MTLQKTGAIVKEIDNEVEVALLISKIEDASGAYEFIRKETAPKGGTA